MNITVPNWVTYPDEDWESITPEEAGLDPNGLEKWVAGLHVRGATFGGEDHSGDKYGAVLTRGGYLVHSWGDRLYAHHTASVGKALTWAVLGFAVDGRDDRPRRADQQVLDRAGRAVPSPQVPDRGTPQDTDVASPHREADGEPALGRFPDGNREPVGGKAHGAGGARRPFREWRNGPTGRATPTTTATRTPSPARWDCTAARGSGDWGRR